MKTLGSILAKATVLNFLSWIFFVVAIVLAEGLSGYSIPDNPLESDYPEPDLYWWIVLMVPWGFWVITIGLCHFKKFASRQTTKEADAFSWDQYKGSDTTRVTKSSGRGDDWK